MKHTYENYMRTIKHLRGFGIDPETISKTDIAQAVEDNDNPLNAANEIVYYER